MTKSELKSQFQNSYNRESWKPILKLVFGQINYFTDPFSLFEGVETVKQGYQIGYVDLPNNQTVAIFEIEVADSIIIERNRKGLRDIAEKFINGTFTAALVFYYSKNQTEYRFSFIAKQSKIDEQTGEHSTIVTAPKRYTYVLGTPFCATAAERWIKLAAEPEITVDKITDAFSVEKLSKEFFDQYKIQYTRFCKFIEGDAAILPQFIDRTESDSVKAQKPLRDYVKKLLGRLVFLQFLQKKGWMGVPAANNDWKGGDLNFMANLFNKSPYQDNFLDAVLEPLFFNTLNAERTNDIAVDIDPSIKIPYLNGGLFEKTTLDDTHVKFPKHYFSELFEFFNQYNFTIDENDPDDAEVGIDPEMLGHIFENLLEDNKDKGAFYTPKEIVRYMCQESLIAYLHTHTPDALHPSVEKLIRTHKVDDCLQDKPNATLIQKLLVAVKICDPAIGSGAFPMGMLNEIFAVRRKLFGILGKNQSFSACLVKKEIIQNNIYGVDIEQGAVDIARLRFWLALVVDEDVPQALPNLDYKIMCGNSLISRFALDAPIKDVFAEYNKKYKTNFTLQDYKNLVDEYTDVHNSKEQFRAKIEEIKGAFKSTLLNSDLVSRKKAEMEVLDYEMVDVFGERKADKDKKGYKTAKTKLEKFLKSEKDTLDNKLYINSFEWRFEFPSLLDDNGNFVGFDVVIGNPPYIQLKWLDVDYSKQKFKTYSNSSDIYCLFYELSNKLLKNQSVGTFITSNKWLRSDYGKLLRSFFIEHTHDIRVVDFKGFKIFDNATVDTNILLWKKGNYSNEILYKQCDSKSQLWINNNWINFNYSDSEIWSFSNSSNSLKFKIESKFKKIKFFPVEFNYGILTGANKTFIINNAKRTELINSNPEFSNLIVPILRGKDLEKYWFTFNEYYIINTNNGIKKKNIKPIELDKDKHARLLDYFESFGDEFKNRGEKGDNWYNLRNCAYLNLYLKPKILYADIVQDSGKFYYDEFGYYSNDTAFMIYSDDKDLLKNITAVLNSKIGAFLYKEFYCGGSLGGKGLRYKKEFLQELPIPNKSDSLIQLVDKFIDLKKQNIKDGTDELEQQIDLLVYKLYELSYEEVLLIEPDFGQRVSVEEYEDVNVLEYEAVSVE